MIKVIIISILLVSIAFAAIAIKIFLKNKGRFSGTCSGRGESSGNKGGCTCGAKPEGECKKIF